MPVALKKKKKKPLQFKAPQQLYTSYGMLRKKKRKLHSNLKKNGIILFLGPWIETVFS